jgi:hypothetical protein
VFFFTLCFLPIHVTTALYSSVIITPILHYFFFFITLPKETNIHSQSQFLTLISKTTFPKGFKNTFMSGN